MENNNIKVGISKIDISPPEGVELCGYAARDGGNLGLLDNVFAKTIAMDDGSNKVAILSCDLIGLDFEIIDSVKVEAKKLLNIDPRGIIISCTHTHSGPVTMHGNGIGLKDKNYIEYLRGKLLESLSKALEKLNYAEVFYHTGECDIGINRRGKIKEGSIEPSPDPNGFVDKQVSVISFHYPGDREPFSILFNYGCHPVVLSPENNLVSSDFPGTACSFIESSVNNKIVPVFTNGGAGNINPVLRGSLNELKINGEKLGKAILDILKTEGKKIDPRLSFDAKVVDFPYSADQSEKMYLETSDEYNKQLNKAKSGSVEEKLCKANIEWANRHLEEFKKGEIPENIQANLQVLKIGDVFLIGIPAEVFAETAMWIKKQSSDKIIVLGYTNGNVGYLPTQAEILKGGYEVLEAHKYYDRPAHYSGKAEENVRYTALKLISKLS